MDVPDVQYLLDAFVDSLITMDAEEVLMLNDQDSVGLRPAYPLWNVVTPL